MPAACHVAIVMPVHNRRETTLRCLRALDALDQDGMRVDTFVVDDGSTDGTADAIARAHPKVHVLHGDGTLFYTGGTNTGLTAALAGNPHYILAMNDDLVADRLLLQRLIGCAQRHPRALVGALLQRRDDPDRLLQVGVTWSTWFGGWHVPRHLRIADVPATPWQAEILVGNCVLYPVAAVRAAGLMNARLFPHAGSDVEYTARLQRMGWRLLIDPSARVVCEPNTNPPPLTSQPLGAALSRTLLDRRQAVNLITQIAGCVTSAPSRVQGAAAACVLLTRWLLKGMRLGGSWPRWADPPFMARAADDADGADTGGRR